MLTFRPSLIRVELKAESTTCLKRFEILSLTVMSREEEERLRSFEEELFKDFGRFKDTKYFNSLNVEWRFWLKV